MTAVAVALVLVIPVAALAALLSVVNTIHARRAERVARQIALTDAIHGVLGPVVAPVVRRGRRGWIAVLTVRAGDPQLGVMIAIAQAELGPGAEIVVHRVGGPELAPQRSARPGTPVARLDQPAA